MSDQKIKYGTVELDADEFNATHSDQELRDKLASEYADKVRSMESGTALEGFVAGWDAARANDSEKNQLREQLQWSLRNEEKYKAALDESFKRETELRAQCEKLAEGLFRAIQWVEIEPMNKEDNHWNDLAFARQALAEYRQTKGK